MKRIRIYPVAEDLIKKTIILPGSKSYTNRALIIASLTKGTVTIKNPLISDDTVAMIRGLKKLGIKIEVTKNAIKVIGSINEVKKGNYLLDAHLAGTTIRFMTALSVLTKGVKTIRGKEDLHKRPIGDLVTALRTLGAHIEYLDKEGYPPIKVFPSTLSKKTVTIQGDTSSQFISSLLMIAPYMNGLRIKTTGKQVSRSYIDITIDIMNTYGVLIKNKNYKEYTIPTNQKYKAISYIVEGDYSTACYFLAIAALTKSVFTLKNLNPYSVQGDKQFISILRKMGNNITFQKNSIQITGRGVKSVNEDMLSCPDQVQTLAVLTAFAEGKTTITGIESLRVKETDRLKALKQELKKMNIYVSFTNTSLTIVGGIPHPAIIKTYNDHRMAMSFAIAGTVLEGMEIEDPEIVSKSFPDFWKTLSVIGIKTKYI